MRKWHNDGGGGVFVVLCVWLCVCVRKRKREALENQPMVSADVSVNHNFKVRDCIVLYCIGSTYIT